MNKLVIIPILLIGILSSIFFLSCGGKESLSNILVKSVREDRVLDSEECEEIRNFIIDNKKKYTDLFTDDNLDEQKYITFLQTQFSSKLRGYDDVKIACGGNTTSTNANIYIENTGSMHGYVKGGGAFKNNLSKIVVDSRSVLDNENVRTSFINTNIYWSDNADLSTFLDKINPSNSDFRQGDIYRSKIDQVIKQVLDSSNNSNISILLSDFIYSVSSNNQSDLGKAQALTQDAFSQYLKQNNGSTLLVKFNSNFSGTYSSYNNKHFVYNGNRPYYLLAVGNDAILKSFINKIDLTRYNGFEDSYFISNSSNYTPYYGVFRSVETSGTYKKSRESKKNNIILEDIKLDNGVFRFTLAVDFSEIPDKKLIEDISNFDIKGDFKITSIEKRTGSFISDNFRSGVVDHVKKSSATHFITLESTQPNFDKKLSIHLANKIPDWVAASNTNDDTDAKASNFSTTTFGIEFFVEGIYDAYKLKNNNTNFLNLNFTLNK